MSSHILGKQEQDIPVKILSNRIASRYQVINVVPTTEDQVRKLVELTQSPYLDFWTEVGLGRRVDIMIPPIQQRESMYSNLQSLGMDPTLMIQDVQELIDFERMDRPVRTQQMTWDDYYNYTEVRREDFVIDLVLDLSL